MSIVLALLHGNRTKSTSTNAVQERVALLSSKLNTQGSLIPVTATLALPHTADYKAYNICLGKYV